MNEQYSLFDAQDDKDARAADSRPAAGSFRRPAPGMRFFKLGMEDGTTCIIETALSMFELLSELRGKQKVKLKLANGRDLVTSIQDVRYLENEQRVPA